MDALNIWNLDKKQVTRNAFNCLKKFIPVDLLLIFRFLGLGQIYGNKRCSESKARRKTLSNRGQVKKLRVQFFFKDFLSK